MCFRVMIGAALFAVIGWSLRDVVAELATLPAVDPTESEFGDRPPNAAVAGALVIVGGGGTPDEVKRRALDLAGGKKAVVAVLPQASRRPEAGSESTTMWKTAGAAEAFVVDVEQSDKAKKLLDRATLIWMSGGSQSRLAEALRTYGVAAHVLRRHRDGVVVGGTSAGAAVMSEVMIARGRSDSISSNAVETAKGLGLLTDFIIDQHFLRRSRFNRLLSTVLAHRHLVGLGIDERTAAIVQGRRIDVVGEGAVVVVDARKATPSKSRQSMTPNPPDGIGWRSVTVDVLRPGESWQLD